MAQELEKPKSANANEQLKKIVEAFSTEKFPEVLSTTYIKSMGKPIENWSFGNKMIAMFEGTTDARTYNQWHKVGRHPKKGSKAFYILAPNTYRKKEINSETGSEDTVTVMKGFRGMPVFRFEDTEGAGLVAPKEPKLPPLMEVAKHFGADVRFEAKISGSYGYFAPRTDKPLIVLCSEDPTVFFHELTHLVHHKCIEKLKLEQDPEQETVAQLSACVLGAMYGIDNMAFSWNYIATYAKTNKPEAVGRVCLKVLSKVQKILKIILEFEEKSKEAMS